MNSDIQGLVSVKDIDAGITSSDDYDTRIAIGIQKATTRLAKTQETSPRSSIWPSTGGSQDSRLKLPKLDLPKLDGSYSQWISFRVLFDGAVHSNSSLTDSQKLFYLKGLLTGEAKRLLSAIAITDANYSEAKEILKQRYENRRAIVRDKLLQLRAIPQQTKNKALCEIYSRQLMNTNELLKPWVKI